MIKKHKKLPKISALKKKAWKAFSVFIRKRGADKYGMNTCVTCGVKKHWKHLHAGHFLHGHSKGSFLMESNVHAQCVRCNHFLSGNLLEYAEYMKKTYGQEEIDHLRELSHQIWKPTREELNKLIEEYSENDK